MLCRNLVTQFSVIFSLPSTIAKGMKHYFLQTSYWLLMILYHLKMGFITFHSFKSFGSLWCSLMYFWGAMSSKALSSLESSLFGHVCGGNGGGGINLSSSLPPCYYGPFLFFNKLSCEDFLSNCSHFPFHNPLSFRFYWYLYILKWSFLRKITDLRFSSFSEFLRCQSYFLQDSGPFHLNYLFLFNSPELIPDEHKTTIFCLYPEGLKYQSASYFFY